MAEYIERDMLLKLLEEKRSTVFPPKHMVHTDTVLQTMYKTIVSIPTADVVRCKDCKSHRPETAKKIARNGIPSRMCRCDMMGWLVCDDDFCSYGERKGR